MFLLIFRLSLLRRYHIYILCRPPCRPDTWVLALGYGQQRRRRRLWLYAGYAAHVPNDVTDRSVFFFL